VKERRSVPDPGPPKDRMAANQSSLWGLFAGMETPVPPGIIPGRKGILDPLLGGAPPRERGVALRLGVTPSEEIRDLPHGT
jgi:hypothetical protein